MKNIVLKIIKKEPKNEKELTRIKRGFAKESGEIILRNSDILRMYFNMVGKKEIKENENIEKLLVKRAIRTMSGIAPVAVLTKPYPCPGKCVYCPHEKDVPVSYLSNEPAVMRAIRNKYSPIFQVQSRLKALEANGHKPEKIELIVIGGTWSYLPKKYKYWYIASLFAAANNYQRRNKKEKIIKINKNTSVDELKKILLREQRKNEKAKYRIIGLTLETRPDYINDEELVEMRELGCTRVEIGVQAIDDKILKLNKRGHGVEDIVKATAFLRKYGFKITYHLMPGLPGATPAKDLKMFKTLFTDSRFQPDQIKFYPTVVVKGSLLYRWWRAGKYKPYSDRVLQKLIIECKKVIPKYVRIIRLIRDIPGESIEAGNKITNLRQVMKDKGVKCVCIRCRESREEKVRERDLKLNIEKYKVGDGKEYFISFDSRDGKTLYGFCRLYLLHPVISQGSLSCSATHIFARSGSDEVTSLGEKKTRLLRSVRNDMRMAIIRELHVYGELVPVGSKKKTQHIGLGKRLLKKAEEIVLKNNFEKIAIISGVGVRGYYKKQGYRLKNTYMVKKLK